MSQYDVLLPAARHEDLVTTESGDELLVYDTKTHVIHHLNPSASVIWRLSDGRQTLASLERAATAILGTEVSREDVESALTSLDGLDLLDGHVTFAAKPANPSRRRFLKKAAAAGVAIPAIVSITSPRAAVAASGTLCDGTLITVEDCPSLGLGTPCWTGVPGQGDCGSCKNPSDKKWVCSV
jgi:hypothetical protein